MRLLPVILLGVLAVSGCGAVKPEAESVAVQPLRILFIGNSLTATNDLPAAVAALSKRRVYYQAVTPGGVNLEDHWLSTGAREVLAEGQWDWVVMQQGPSSLPESQADLRKWARTWAAEIREHGARPALWTVWPERQRLYAFDSVVRSYRDAAAAARARILPAGDAWLEAWRRKPTLQLYGADGFHPSALGTYLAAVVVYSGITGVPPTSLPTVGLPPGVATHLQRAAATALRR